MKAGARKRAEWRKIGCEVGAPALSVGDTVGQGYRGQIGGVGLSQ